MRVEGVQSLLAVGERRSREILKVSNPHEGKHPSPANSVADPPFQKVIGCNAPRLRLVADALAVDTPEQALEAISRIPQIDQVAVLRGVQQPVPRPYTSPGPHLPAGQVSLATFTPDDIEVKADVAAPGGAWLVYASSHHPDWSVTVDGAPAPLIEAYRAFQAVHLDPGSHDVRFSFRSNHHWIGNGLMWFGVLGTLAFCSLFGWVLFSPGQRFLARTAANR
jgi:hypothetical protein